MAATTTINHGRSIQSAMVKPPVHPTYDLKGVIKLALSEDAGDKGPISVDIFTHFVTIQLFKNYSH